MRIRARASQFTLKGYSGPSTVLLAMDAEPAKRKGLLGFAIERTTVNGREAGRQKWLDGKLTFKPDVTAESTAQPTSRSPIQKFRWGDYTVFPGTEYRYRLHGCYGTPKNLELEPGPTIDITTQGLEQKPHSIVFNRAVAASQAFQTRYPHVDAEMKAAKKQGKLANYELPEDALDWLQRDLLNRFLAFVGGAGPQDSLDVAIYEYELPRIRDAIYAAAKRGVTVRLLHHGRKGDKQTKENLHGVSTPNLRVEGKIYARTTTKIMHDKFIVLSKIEGEARRAQAVLCGSTNFTHNGVYRQGNVVHVVSDPAVAKAYLECFETLIEDPSVADTKTYHDAHSPIAGNPDVACVFSPRSKQTDLDAFVHIIEGAKRDVLFCTAFDLHPKIDAALLGAANDPILRFGLENKKTSITGFHADRSADFTATAFLSSGLEGWQKESLKGQRGNLLIHTKAVVVDFTGNAPTVFSGSHNLSKAASESNDENLLIVRGNTDVADAYGTELIRLYDHYRFRWYIKQRKSKTARPLSRSDDWTEPYFTKSSLKYLDRVRFSS